MFTAVGVFGVATIAFGLSTSFWFSLAVLVVLGAADMISMVIRASFVQLETPDDMRGRSVRSTACLSARRINWASSNPGSPPTGSAPCPPWSWAGSARWW